MTRRTTSSLKSIVDLLGKRLSTATLGFHAALADRMGVSVADNKCLSILLQFGPMTAGELAQRIGLTTGAVTGVIDRLERARFAHRTADPKDRRRVVVEPALTRKREQELSELFGPMGSRVLELTAGYSEKDQATIGEFLTKACTILEEETVRLRAKRSSGLR
jgi:DNA-binding MarR family transcriptional regulator